MALPIFVSGSKAGLGTRRGRALPRRRRGKPPFCRPEDPQDQQRTPGLACEPRALKQFIQFLALA
jgi:hypothetical protein